METYGGRKFYLLESDTCKIFIDDIAWALSNICRFNGHCKNFYSVAEHSIMVSRYTSINNKKWGLLHDAAEAYIGDLSRPLRACFKDGVIEKIENVILEAVANQFSLPFPIPEEVKRVDNLILASEAKLLMVSHGNDWELEESPDHHISNLECWPPKEAYDRFLREASLLDLI